MRRQNRDIAGTLICTLSQLTDHGEGGCSDLTGGGGVFLVKKIVKCAPRGGKFNFCC